MRLTPFHRERYIARSWEGSVLVLADAYYVPMMVCDLEARKLPYFYANTQAFEIGYQAVCEMQEALLMDVYTGLVREIRALRGVDELDPGYDDPATDPFSLRMGHLEKVAVELEGVNAKLQAVVDALAAQQAPAELGDIVETLGTIAALLA